MLQQWKLILTNWVNCYIDKLSEDDQNLNRESLQTIISHLRENLNLDESKSSSLEAHTIQEFLCEKYPEFKFKNGTAEAESEEEIGLVASLLLFFVCVNSKNLDIKSAMCSKLSSEDQEIILKFSQYLMECPVISRREVEAAITEACGQNQAAMVPRKHSVAETPPALRSLHGEVRRLQAALDAERFDRNYLQEELARTNARLERLLKEKDQHKLDILNLKAKISLCCGEHADAKNSNEAADKTAKLTRQLQQLELNLEETQVQLNDVVYERDSYKTKIDELKHERDKWLTLSQQESTRLLQVSEELDTERRHTQSLRDLVAELRQHNKLNRLDTSSLECDDPDASIHSLAHNSSVCSELCANVVEVQLGEERAKIVVLTQQIQTLQDQINELNKKTENEKASLETVIAQRENDIFNLKHRINEEIEDKNNMKILCDSEITKLNNEINELDQKYKDYKEHSSSVTETKMQEIQTLQEEKLSLIQSLNSETTKLENKIKVLQTELDTERQTRSNMKEGYENHIMKLNEKVLNRNNELVELQNSIFEKGEKIETLQIEVKKEKEVIDKLKQEYKVLHEQKIVVESELQMKSEEATTLHAKIQQNNTEIEDMNSEIEELKMTLSSLNNNIKALESAKEQMFDEIKNRDIKLEEMIVNVNHMNELYKAEKDKLLQEIDEKNATITSLQNQLQSEIMFKVGLQNDLTQENLANNTLKEELEKINSKLNKHITEIEEKDRTINSMNLSIEEEKKLKDDANRKVLELTDELKIKNNSLQILKEELDSVSKSLEDEIQKYEEYKEMSQNKLISEIAERESIHLQLKSLMIEKELVDKDLSVKNEEYLVLNEKYEQLMQKLEEKESRIRSLETNLEQEYQAKVEMSLQKESEINELKSRLVEFENLNEKSTEEREVHLKTINYLEKENEKFKFTIEEDNSSYEIVLNKKDKIIEELEQKDKENIVKIETLTSSTDELKTSLENYTQLQEDATSTLKLKENKIIELNEMALNLEQKLNGMEQENCALEKNIAKMEESLAMKEREFSLLATEKENVVSENRSLLAEKENMLEEQRTLRNKLADEKSLTKFTEYEKCILMSEKEELISEKSVIADKLKAVLFNETTADQIAAEEAKNIRTEIIETKQKLSKEIEKNATHMQEKECLTQCLNEEVSLKIITEKEKENLIAEKDLLVERLGNTEMSLQTLNNEIDILQQNIIEDKKSLVILKEQNNILTEELAKQYSVNDVLKADKEMLKNALQNEKCAHDELETEKNDLSLKLQTEIANKVQENNNLSEKYNKLTEQFEDLKLAQESLIKEKDIVIQDLKSAFDELTSEKESVHKTLNTEKNMREHVQSEKNALIAKFELDLINKDETIEKLAKEIKELNTILAEEKLKLESVTNEKDLITSEKETLIETEKCENEKLLQDIEELTAIVTEEKLKLEAITTEKDILISEKQFLIETEKCENQKLSKTIEELTAILAEEKLKLEAIKTEQDLLVSEKETLIETEKFTNEKLSKNIEELNAILAENNLKQESMITERDLLISEKESLMQTLTTVNNEKENLAAEIEKMSTVLIEEKLKLESIAKERELLITEKETLIESLNTAKCAKEKLSKEIEELNLNLAEEKLKLQSLILEKDVVITEKESLKESLNIEKCAKDELESEKKRIENEYEKLSSLNNEVEANLKMSTEKIDSLETNVKNLQEAIQSGLNKLTEKLKQESINNNILQKVINENNIDDLDLPKACNLVINVAEILAADVILKEKLEVTLKNENEALSEMQEILKEKEGQVFELQTEIKRLEQAVHENKIEKTKQSETYITSMNSKIKDIQTLQEENKSLSNDLNDVKVDLEVKVHSLKEKLVENELITDKLKKSYECQIDNLNVMVTKLTNYLKEKTLEMEILRKEKEQLQASVANNLKVIQTLEDEAKTDKQNMEKLISDFDSERQVLKNMITVTESVMEDQKTSLTNTITENTKTIESLQEKNDELYNTVKELDKKIIANDLASNSLLTLLRLERRAKEDVEKESEYVREYLDEVISYLSKERNSNTSVISALEFQEKTLVGDYEKMKNDLESVQKDNEDLKMSNKDLQNDMQAQGDMLTKFLEEKVKVETILQEKENDCSKLQLEVKELKNKINELIKEKSEMEQEKSKFLTNIEECTSQLMKNSEKEIEEITTLQTDNQKLLSKIEENETVITELEQRIKQNVEENDKIRQEKEQEMNTLTNKYTQLEEYQTQTIKLLEERENINLTFTNQIEELQTKIDFYDTIISTISKELTDEKAAKENLTKELEEQKTFVNELRNNMEYRALKTENEQLIRAIGQKETLTALCQEDKFCHQEPRDHQVDNTETQTITDLEKIVQDKNRTITTLQTDISYMKTLMAESETKVLDLSRELEVSKENCQQLSSQLKKIVYQKNEEIAELKKQVNKMSATENRATQIIKVSAKYQAMILKRIAEIKSNTVLKELTNFGNGDNEVRRSLAGTVTMEDLENFLETTDRHLKRCAEKQITLQKERDRLIEVNRINESEIINMRKFLTEMSVSFQTFSSLKDMYGQKLSRVISVQRTVRREILSLDGRVTDAAMCKLERGYGAAMQDLSECTMNMERWVERSISRTVSVEKIKQAFTSDSERLSLSTPTFQNTGLEVQLEELEKLFQKLLEEVARAVKGDGAKNEQATTVMEVRAEYEDKLNRMKAKMKDLFNEQMTVLKSKQREDIAVLERELQKANDRMEQSKRSYESHIKELTRELWTMSEKFLVKNDEAQWLMRKQQSGSLMSLQHVHSSGLVSHHEPPSRPSDTHSLRSLPVRDTNTKTKREGRGLHMSDEEGEVFDNRYLKELSTPRRPSNAHIGNNGQRLSELKWRNSLCLPHLKSSYPAEMQFSQVVDEEDVKAGSLGGPGSRSQRKEVGITAYKKPGPPTPSKQAGRLSATDSELRESLRVECEPTNDRKTSTPGRIRAFLGFNRNNTNEGTPRARRLSNIFRKKQ